jgi:leader peptidase (prepilin peptidase)/N-methyltransferase
LLFIFKALFFFFLGASFGSFFNAVSYRISFYFYSPERKKYSVGSRIKKLFFKPSFCPHCKAKINPFLLIPVLGFFLSQGRCRHCGKGISVYYLLGEIYLGLVALTSLWPEVHRDGVSINQILAVTLFLVALGHLYIIIVIDRIHFSIDIYPIIGIFLFQFFYLLMEQGSIKFAEVFFIHLKVALGAFIFFFLTYLFSGRRIGWGDVLLSFPLGFLIGHPYWMISFNAAFILACGYAFSIHLLKKMGHKDYKDVKFRGGKILKMKLPLGSFLGISHLLVILYIKLRILID